jgi:hypothetical protein
MKNVFPPTLATQSQPHLMSFVAPGEGDGVSLERDRAHGSSG